MRHHREVAVMTRWIGIDPRYGPDSLGFLPDILTDADKRPVREQLEDRYAHGGGWRPIKGFRLRKGSQDILASPTLRFPGDPPLHAIAMAKINEETVILYAHSFLAVVAKDGSWEVTRVD